MSTSVPRTPLISASVLNADFARLGEEVRRAVDGGVDSIHLDVMDGHFVENITMGPVVVEALRGVELADPVVGRDGLRVGREARLEIANLQ